MQTNCYVTAGTVIEDDVFVGPGVTLTNDNTMGRHDPGPPDAPTLRRACRVGGGAVICPGIEIGEEAFVGAGAVVTADVPAARSSSASPRSRSARSARTTSSSAGASPVARFRASGAADEDRHREAERRRDRAAVEAQHRRAKSVDLDSELCETAAHLDLDPTQSRIDLVEAPVDLIERSSSRSSVQALRSTWERLLGPGPASAVRAASAPHSTPSAREPRPSRRPGPSSAVPIGSARISAQIASVAGRGSAGAQRETAGCA